MSSKNKFWAGVIALALAAVFLASMILTQPIAAAPDGAAPNQLAGSADATASATRYADQNADILVIGAGGAGLTAAIQAAQDGAANVVVVEKMPVTGGNTIRSTGGLNACGTQYQRAEGIEDSVELFVEDTMKGGKELNDKALVTAMAEHSADAVDWVNGIGGDLSVVGMFGGASVKRIHRPTDTGAVGPMLMKALNAKAGELNIPVILNTKAAEIVAEEGGWGVWVTGPVGTYLIHAKAVVLATGGFGANAELVAEYQPGLAGFGTTNHAGATGDGIAMARHVGAAFVDLDQIQTHPTVNPDTQTMYTEGVRGNGAILVNKEGKRFVDELETRDVVSAAILEQTDGQCWLVFDQAVRDSLSAIESYISAGIVFEGESPEELAGQIGVDAGALAETLAAYAGYADAGEDPDFGRADMESRLDAPKFYAALCAPAVHHTMGGVKIDTGTRMLDEAGSALPGLFAAGEVTGGVHGANRLGGNAVTDIVVFGRIAGSAAAAYVQANGGHTAPTMTAALGRAGDDAPAVPEVQGNYRDGTYTGTGKGNNGPITVAVTVEGGNVTAVELTDHAETDGIYQNAERGVVRAVIRTQTTEGVDTVAGATYSSQGILEAVADALRGAVQ